MSTLERKHLRTVAGQRIIMGFPGDSLTPELREVLEEVQPAGIILFGRNIASAEAASELNREIKAQVGRPLLASVDQEGGRVARVRNGATCWPPMRRLGQLASQPDGLARATELAQEVGGALADELRAMHFDVNYAPVLDVDTNPANPIIGDRAFSHDPEVVACLGSALARGLQAHGVAACGKHFPGHGDTEVDSHLALPTIHHSQARLAAVEWLPFRRAIEAGISSIMSAHVRVIDLDPNLPATCSPAALRLPLRETLGFEGIIISDDVEMRGLADHHSPAEVARLGDQAGVDIFLACHHYEVTLTLYRALVQQLEAAPDGHDDALAQAARIGAWVRRYYQSAKRPPHGARHVVVSHQRLADQLAPGAIDHSRQPAGHDACRRR